jgi:hypothetical protein
MVTLYEFSYHCFLSYTTREEEVREVQPRVDELIERFTNYGYQVAPIFYDHYIFGSRTPSNLRAALSRANHESAFMVIDFIKVCRVSWPTDLSPSDGGAYAQL